MYLMFFSQLVKFGIRVKMVVLQDKGSLWIFQIRIHLCYHSKAYRYRQVKIYRVKEDCYYILHTIMSWSFSDICYSVFSITSWCLLFNSLEGFSHCCFIPPKLPFFQFLYCPCLFLMCLWAATSSVMKDDGKYEAWRSYSACGREAARIIQRDSAAARDYVCWREVIVSPQDVGVLIQ